MPFSGEPRTIHLPSRSSMSAGSASSWWATIALALSATFFAACAIASPPTASVREPAGARGRGAVGVQAERARGGVAVDDVDLLGIDAQAVGHDLGEARLMA